MTEPHDCEEPGETTGKKPEEFHSVGDVTWVSCRQAKS